MCELCAQPYPRLPRRHFLAAGMALAAAAPFAAPFAANAAPAPSSTAPNAISPDAAEQILREGNARYAANKPANQNYSHDRAGRASAQYPIAAILSCSDSRVAPELIFDQGPGQVFVVRVAGNFVSDDGLASLEYAVKFLGVPLLAILGHTGCGAIAAAIKVIEENAVLPGHLPGLIRNIKPAVRAAMAHKPKDLLEAATRENVRANIDRLNADQPIVGAAVAAGSVKVIGGVYDISTGLVSMV